MPKKAELFRQEAIIHRFWKLIHDEPYRTPCIAEIGTELAVPERTLRQYCVDLIGMSPKQYLWHYHMLQAHEALKHADPRTATVTDIATRFGFRQLGRFAARYRSTSGELPSQTLRCKPGKAN